MFHTSRTLRSIPASWAVKSTKLGLCVAGLALLSACSTAKVTQSGFLSDYSQLQPYQDAVRARVYTYRDPQKLAAVQQVHIEPVQLGEGVGTRFSPEERALILSELDRQVCYEVSERFEIASEENTQAARLRIAATRVLPTDAVGSAASAVVNRFIPGPIGLRLPGSTGGLAAEAELLDADGAQVAALVWARDAQIVGTDNPSLSRVGDAHQLAEPFGDMIAASITPEGRQSRPIPDPDPCERYGPRIRPEGFVARVVTGLYTPELSGGTETRSNDTEQTPPATQPKP